MNPEKIIFAFFIILALSLNVAFVTGELDNPDHHNVYLLYAVFFVNAIATILKLGERSSIGAVLLATSMAADLQLLSAILVWAIAVYATDVGLTAEVMATVVSLCTGAVVANLISVVLLVVETTTQPR